MKTDRYSLTLVFCICLVLALAMALPERTQTARAAPAACATGNHSGTISTDETWCLIHSPHYISGHLTVGASATLTIEPGVVVYVSPGVNLVIQGGLVAEGSSGNGITITSVNGSPQPGDWGAIVMEPGSHVRIAYADLSYGAMSASTYHGLNIKSSDVQIRHSRIHHFKDYVVYLEGTGLTPQLEDLEIDHNPGNTVMRQTTVNQQPVYHNVWLHDNGVNALWISLSNLDRNVTLDGSPTALNGAPIHYDAGSVLAGNTLTVTAGTTLKFAGNRQLDVRSSARLVAEGTPTLPITFTMQSAAPQPGDWAGISFAPGSSGKLAYFDLAYAGAAGGANRGLNIGSSDVEARHGRIHHTFGVALSLEGTGLTPQIEDLEIDHNPGTEPLRQNTINQQPSYSNIRLHDNGLNALIIPLSNVDRNITLDGSPAPLNGAPIHYEGGSVLAGNTLTVTAGTTLKFAGNRPLDVRGRLVAEGTPTLPITFTMQSAAPQPGDWAGIGFEPGSSGRLAYFDLAYAGSPGGANRGLNIGSSDVEARHGRIHHTFGVALNLEGTGLTPQIEDLEIDHNPGTEPLRQNTINQQPSYSNIRLHDNGLNALVIPLSTVDRNITLDGSPAALNGAPVYYEGGTVNAGKALTVTAGTTIKFAAGRPLQVYGRLMAEGTPALPVVFTTRTASPAPGDWGPLGLQSGSSARLAYCEIAYSGAASGGSRGVMIASSDVQMRACRIHHSGGYALHLNNNIQAAFQNLAITDSPLRAVNLMPGARLNAKHFTLARNATAAYVSSTGTLTLTNSILSANTTGLNVQAGGSAVASYNLWDANGTDATGTVADSFHFTGPALFAADGYHLTVYSLAAGRGAAAGVTTDIDGQTRPQPAGTPPDLGADEDPSAGVWRVYLPVTLK